MGSKTSNKSIDDWYAKAINHYALGGKISDVGRGGFLTLIAEPSKHNELVHELDKNVLQEHSFGL